MRISPSPEIAISGTNISAVWKVRAARTSTVPSPFVAAIISARNTTMQAITSATRQPVRIEGAAAGSTTVNNVAVRDAPAARADQTSLGSTARAPARVASRIGKTASATTRRIFETLSKPKSSTSAG